MKKYIPLLLLGALTIAIIVLAILYMSPEIARGDFNSSNQKQTSDSNEKKIVTQSVGIPNQDQTIVSKGVDKNTDNNASIQSDQAENNEEVDFNKKVYGYIPTEAEAQNATKGSRNIELYNPASNPEIKPIDPTEDPSNHIYSAEKANTQ